MAEPRKTGGAPTSNRAARGRAYERPIATVRTDSSGKNATDVGLTPAQKRAVIAEETRVRKFKTEYGAVISPDGKVTHRVNQGKAHNVSFASVPNADLKDAVVIHNHPGSGQRKLYGNTLATRIGSPLSPQDLIFAANQDVAEIRATTYSGDGGGYTYSIRRPEGGWLTRDVRSLKNLAVRTRNYGQTIVNRGFRQIASNRSATSTEQKQRASRAELIAQWESINEMARMLGTRVTRRRFNP